MVTLIHNVFNTDLLMLIHDEDTVRGMEVVQSRHAGAGGPPGRARRRGRSLVGRFGPSCICNIIGAIKTAKYLGLGPEDNVVTIATDSYDRYPSVSQALYARNGGKPERRPARDVGARASSWAPALGEIVDLNKSGQHARLQQMKKDLWTRFGYSGEYIRRWATRTSGTANTPKSRRSTPSSPRCVAACRPRHRQDRRGTRSGGRCRRRRLRSGCRRTLCPYIFAREPLVLRLVEEYPDVALAVRDGKAEGLAVTLAVAV